MKTRMVLIGDYIIDLEKVAYIHANEDRSITLHFDADMSHPITVSAAGAVTLFKWLKSQCTEFEGAKVEESTP